MGFSIFPWLSPNNAWVKMYELDFNLEESCGGGGRGINTYTAWLCRTLWSVLHHLSHFYDSSSNFAHPNFWKCGVPWMQLCPFFFFHIHNIEHMETEAGPRGPEVSPGSLGEHHVRCHQICSRLTCELSILLLQGCQLLTHSNHGYPDCFFLSFLRPFSSQPHMTAESCWE